MNCSHTNLFCTHHLEKNGSDNSWPPSPCPQHKVPLSFLREIFMSTNHPQKYTWENS